MSSPSFISGNRSIGLNQFHFEWCPKYRKDILNETNLSEFVKDSLRRTAYIYKIIIHNVHVSKDHIHMFVSLPFDLSVSKAFQYFKGRSARELFEAFPYLRNIFSKGHLWSPGKFCRSISNVKSETIKHYIENHKFKELNESIQQARAEAEQMRLSQFF